MKGFINKRDKIKWEDNPFEPEFSEEKIADMIGESEDITGAIVDTVKENVELDDLKNMDTTRIEAGQFLTKDEYGGDWFTALPALQHLADTSIVPSELEDGDTIVYDAVSQTFTNAHEPAWELVDTITADGTVDKIRKTIADTYTGFFIASNLKTGAADANFGIVFEFNTDPVTRKALGDITAGIPASGQSYINAYYEKDGNMWNGYMTTKGTNTTTVQQRLERLDSYFIESTSGLSIVMVEIRTTSSGAVLPDGSTFTIYGKK